MDTDRPLHENWKKQIYWLSFVFVGLLPDSFLRIEERNEQLQQEVADQQAALALQQQIQSMPVTHDPRVGRLSVTISQAKLVRNYEMTRMDSYVTLQVGHAVYETHTDSNSGKNSYWNKVIQCLLSPGVIQIFIEIYDECSFMMDELIAWGHIEIPPQVFQKGETHEDWYMLSGKQGENQEGIINLVFSYTNKCHPYMSSSIMMVPSATPMFGVPYAPLNVYIPPPAVATPTVAPSFLPNAEIELKQIAEMFPNIDKESFSFKKINLP
ncbi:toll-interacting protein B-like [Nylanderia fulva]|uniref:toll-interacting protein B-like n=1 Tax=Nylanderia fulva TaxID=613905 RepID=UPI0010FB4BA3|nr:toll-interacting protein B-like [Nylanderia fulva]XP_029172853.1 toll-interacting protein B-like [Nylanderia fulva]XP_029177083.1 toll-interacting protein B-like [Nylanderia fulva]